MPSDWKPNAPALKKAFTQAHNAEKPAPKKSVASILELRQLERQRKKPAPAQTLEMRGPVARAATSQAKEQNEIRISQIKNQLAQQRGRARAGFNRAR